MDRLLGRLSSGWFRVKKQLYAFVSLCLCVFTVCLMPVLARPAVGNIFDPAKHATGNRTETNQESGVVRRQRSEVRFPIRPRRVQVILDIRYVENGNGRSMVFEILRNSL